MVNMLEFLRDNCLAHRDLKPDNILITEDYHLKLVSNIGINLID